ncbi:MAG: hypothetical protein CSA32_02540 [Desulfobulbus propionicus]|nr:MAG: hypothetical protein CSA32_02540 [Desulfobulbus propionicus]
MEKLVSDLKKVLPFKAATNVGDIVFVASKKPQIMSYAVICSIERDDTRKEEWWHVTMQFLGVPLQKVTWTLRTPQFTGQEIFTMGGEGRFIQAIQPDIDHHSDVEKANNREFAAVSRPGKGLRRIK